jgi:hypothetical protein
MLSGAYHGFQSSRNGIKRALAARGPRRPVEIPPVFGGFDLASMSDPRVIGCLRQHLNMEVKLPSRSARPVVVPVTAQKRPDGRLHVLGPEPNDQDWYISRVRSLLWSERSITMEQRGHSDSLGSCLGRYTEPPKVRISVSSRSTPWSGGVFANAVCREIVLPLVGRRSFNVINDENRYQALPRLQL